MYLSQVVKGPSLLDVVLRCIGTTSTTLWEGLTKVLRFTIINETKTK